MWIKTFFRIIQVKMKGIKVEVKTITMFIGNTKKSHNTSMYIHFEIIYRLQNNITNSNSQASNSYKNLFRIIKHWFSWESEREKYKISSRSFDNTINWFSFVVFFCFFVIHNNSNTFVSTAATKKKYEKITILLDQMLRNRAEDNIFKMQVNFKPLNNLNVVQYIYKYICCMYMNTMEKKRKEQFVCMKEKENEKKKTFETGT